MKYVVLLRGINISGKNKISMSELKSEIKNNNYKNVITYLNSGNVILESDLSKEDITKDIHNIILNRFKIDIPIYVISTLELKDILNNKPNWFGTDDKTMYDNIIFIIPPVKFIDVYNSIGEVSTEIEKIMEYKNVIFWSFELKNYRKSNWWVKTSSASIKDSITIRTCNTITKILELCNK